MKTPHRTTHEEKLYWMFLHREEWEGYPWIGQKSDEERRKILEDLRKKFKAECFMPKTGEAYIYMPNWISKTRARMKGFKNTILLKGSGGKISQAVSIHPVVGISVSGKVAQ